MTAYPTPTIQEIVPEVWLSSDADGTPPAINAGDADPTNLANAFGPTTPIVVDQPSASNQPIWQGRAGGWEFAGDDQFEINDPLDYINETDTFYFAAIAKFDASSTSLMCLAGNQLGTGDPGASFQIDNRNGDLEMRIVANNVYSYGNGTAPDDGEFHLYEFVRNSGGPTDLRIDGELVGGQGVSYASGAPSNMLIGAQEGGNNRFVGHMREVVFSDVVPADLSTLPKERGFGVPSNEGTGYPPSSIITLKPQLYIDSKLDTSLPGVDEGDESPKNLGELFYPGGTGITVSQAAGSNQPIWRGRGAGWEAGGDDWWQINGMPATISGVTVAVVCRRTAGSGAGTIFNFEDGGDGNIIAPYFTSDNDCRFYAKPDNAVDTVDFRTISADNTVPVAYVCAADIATGAHDFRDHRGNVDTATQTYTSDFGASLAHLLVRDKGFKTGEFSGDVWEVLVAFEYIAPSEQIALAEQLAAKWGLS